MRLSDRNPAIYAGLLGVGMWTNPVQALALQVPQTAEKIAVPWLEIGVGCVAGAAFSGAVYLGVSLVTDYLDSRDDDDVVEVEPLNKMSADAQLIPVDSQELQEQRAALVARSNMRASAKPEPSLTTSEQLEGPVVAKAEAAHADVAAEPVRPRGRHMMAAKTDERPMPSEGKTLGRHAAHAKPRSAANEPHQEAKAQPKTAAPRARAALASLPMIDAEPATYLASEVEAHREAASAYANASVGEAAPARRAPRFKKVEPAAQDAPKAVAREPRFKQFDAIADAAPKSARTPRFKTTDATEKPASATHFKNVEAAPSVEKEAVAEVAPAARAASKVADDYAEVAERYVKKMTLAERLATRASGVANALSSRLKSDMFDDLPVISRSDGTVADIGTDWWDSAMGNSVRGVVNMSSEDTGFESVSIHGSLSPSMAMSQSAGSLGRSGSASAAPRHVMTDGEKRSAYISKNVAEVRVGMYPEHRTAEDLDQDDMWERALKAMGERIERENGMVPPPVPVFSDIVGGVDTIDEPDGLDGDTNFIPFKKPAGHPEVVDSSTYVNYLIDDEFSKSSSPVVRKSSADYLRVIRGGSQKSRPLPVQRMKNEYAPRHFAPRSSSLSLVGA